MTRQERRWVLIFAFILVLITSLPYMAAFEAAGQDWVFTGFLVGVEDGNSYLAKMLRGSFGEWMFRTPYTTVEQPGVLTFLPYLLLGKLAAGPAIHSQLIGLFQLFRVGGVLLSVWATYRFASLYLTTLRSRRWTTVLVTAGSGWGWLILPWVGADHWKLLPLSFISPETFGFIASLTVPHLAVARGLLLISLMLILDSMASGKFSLWTPVTVLATFLFNPLAGASLMLVLSVFHLAHLGAVAPAGRWRVWGRAVRSSLWASSLALPYVLYLAISYKQQTFLQGWAEQNLILSPHAGYYLLAYGGLAVPAIFGFSRLLQFERPAGLQLAAWLLVLPLLPYLPVGVQRRLPEAGWVALAITAALGLERIPSQRVRQLGFSAILITSLVAPSLLIWGAWQTAIQPAQPAFVPRTSARAFGLIADRAALNEVVIANFRNSNALPAWAPVRVPIGHGPESINGDQLRREVQQFFQSYHEGERVTFLEKLGADWLLVEVKDEMKPFKDGPWQRTAEFDGISVYRVLLEP